MREAHELVSSIATSDACHWWGGTGKESYADSRAKLALRTVYRDRRRFLKPDGCDVWANGERSLAPSAPAVAGLADGRCFDEIAETPLRSSPSFTVLKTNASDERRKPEFLVDVRVLAATNRPQAVENGSCAGICLPLECSRSRSPLRDR
jgi:hypothetical protein